MGFVFFFQLSCRTKTDQTVLKYSNRNDNEEMVRLPKVWMHKPVKVAATFNEISSTSTSSDLNFLGKLYVNESDSSLVIRDVSINDTGFYYCLLNWKDNQTAKPYFLDSSYFNFNFNFSFSFFFGWLFLNAFLSD